MPILLQLKPTAAAAAAAASLARLTLQAPRAMQDVVYFFQPDEDCLVTISTCNSAQFVDDFDTILYVLGNATGPGSMGVVSCNDDACSFLSQLQVQASCLCICACICEGVRCNVLYHLSRQ